jgi:V/A-type H+-transporting ATPase subunit E
MEVQLKELIDKIKNDGVKSAEENAAKIIADAENRAADILRNAEEGAAKLRNTAKADAEKAERSGKEALRQAGRDLILTVRREIESIFGRVLQKEVAESLSGAVLADAVAAAVKNLSGENAADLDVLLPSEALSQVEGALQTKLASELAAGMEIKPFQGLDAGFRVSRKDGTAFFDFSNEEIATLLGRYLNPRLARLLAE